MKKFLIVIDMQKDFIDGALGTKEAQQIVKKVMKKIELFEGEICCTRDTHQNNYLETQEGRNLPVVHCIKGSQGWEIELGLEEAMTKKGAKFFDKNTFGSLDLAHYLGKIEKKEQIESIELIGLCTDICVISNAIILKAAFPEIPIIVDSSCCAGVTPQSHENALKAMEMCQIHVI